MTWKVLIIVTLTGLMMSCGSYTKMPLQEQSVTRYVTDTVTVYDSTIIKAFGTDSVRYIIKDHYVTHDRICGKTDTVVYHTTLTKSEEKEKKSNDTTYIIVIIALVVTLLLAIKLRFSW